MSITAPNLDDLRFQKDLVDEARRRIIRYCPEWTDYNLSDPGITLIELFAWMTETMLYRLNRVPDRMYLKFMEFMGIQLQSASSATTELTFYLSAPLPLHDEDETVVGVPLDTAVATRRSEEDDEVIFTTDQRLEIIAPQHIYLYTEQNFRDNQLNRARNENRNLNFKPFQDTPQVDDALYLGFEAGQILKGHILRLDFSCQDTGSIGIDPEDPPLIWEYPTETGGWLPLDLSRRPGEKDTTKGFNEGQGQLILYLPTSFTAQEFRGREANWIRCRHKPRDDNHREYRQSPTINQITAYSMGATVPATNAVVVHDEFLGRSTGEPGQVFQLQHAPVLKLEDGEFLVVEDQEGRERIMRPWELKSDFSGSDEYDRHFSLNINTGEVRFGSVVRDPKGGMQRYGRVPEAGCQIFFSRYRYGGGTAGNVTPHKIQVLKSTIPYVDRVTNLVPATGGRDPETLDEAKMRAARELRAQERAVTPEDFEAKGAGASRAVARVKCLTPDEGNGALSPGSLELLVVPAIPEGLRADNLASLHLKPELQKTVQTHLNQYRLLTTTLTVREPRYLGIKVVAEIVPEPHHAPERVRQRVIKSLNAYLTPLTRREPPTGLTDSHQNGADPERTTSEDPWEGWPFGQDLYLSEVYAQIQQVPGVKHVFEVQLSRRVVEPSQEGRALTVREEAEGETGKDLEIVTERVIRLPVDTLVCSLEHEIQIAEF